MKHTAMRLCLAVVAAFAATLAAGAARADDRLIPKGTVVPVVLVQDVSSATAKVGAMVKAIYTGVDEGGFPNGTIFVGTITEVSPKTDKASGKVKVAFKEAVLPDTRTIPIDGIPVGATPPPQQETKKKKRGGAGRGAVLGAAVAGDNRTGAIVGTFVGVAASSADAAKASKPTEAQIKKGTAFGIQLQAVAKVPPAPAPIAPAPTAEAPPPAAPPPAAPTPQ